MPIYEFQCSDGHLSEKRLPLTSEEREADCPDCGLTAHRIISAPFTRRVDAAKASAVESTQKSAYETEVVRSVPGGGKKRATPVTRDPQHAKLPKP